MKLDATSPRDSFDPRAYSTDCTTKADCMLAPFIHECSTCCGQAAVNAAAAQTDLDAVRQTCAGRGPHCDMVCTKEHVECVEQHCIACGEQTCKNGVLIHATITIGLGEHLFEAKIDGATTVTCTVRFLNLTTYMRQAGCSGGAQLSEEGSTGPSSWTFGILLDTTTAKSIAFRVTHDGTLVGEKTFDATYATQPGPNGPQCEPKQCLIASATFP